MRRLQRRVAVSLSLVQTVAQRLLQSVRVLMSTLC